MKKVFVCLFFLSVFSSLSAQDQSTLPATQFDTSGFPQWAKDLRRGEIVAFGSFPFAFFFATISMDLYRSASHGWDRRYAPWPVKPAGSIDMTKDEQILTLSLAAGGAVLIALTDYAIVRYKRSKADKRSRELPAGTPIIIRKPLGEEAGPAAGETEEDG
ncbi:MAG: hypothetical protein LBQ67_02990 [Treponema sp.]|jgi:hypothetical protein|nr:hypothetical protein [Treponema sp.]